jgi:hypothetical protein
MKTRRRHRKRKTMRKTMRYGGTVKKYIPLLAPDEERKKKIGRKSENAYSVLRRNNVQQRGPLPSIKTPQSISLNSFIRSGSYANDTPKVKKLVKHYNKMIKKK